jgi:hypothetical protein
MAVFTAAACGIRINVAAPATCRRGITASARLDRRSAALLLLSAAAPVASPANAASIGLFGIRKKLERAEEEAARVAGEAVKETVEAAEKEAMDVAGEGLQLVGAGGEQLVQAAAIAGAEALGVVVGLSVVNSILKPES